MLHETLYIYLLKDFILNLRLTNSPSNSSCRGLKVIMQSRTNLSYEDSGEGSEACKYSFNTRRREKWCMACRNDKHIVCEASTDETLLQNFAMLKEGIVATSQGHTELNSNMHSLATDLNMPVGKLFIYRVTQNH